MTQFYLLPCAPEQLCEDRFSILDSDELQVSFWNVLEALLQRPLRSSSALIDLLETIAATKHGRTDSDYGSLREFLEKDVPEDFYSRVWPLISRLALRMPTLFPDNRLPILCEAHEQIKLSRTQVGCLVIHQFMCTLTAPAWQQGFQDFHIWYAAEQPHQGAVHAYLTSLFEYFNRIGDPEDQPSLAQDHSEWMITYTLHTGSIVFPNGEQTLTDLKVVNLPSASTSPDVLGLPDGACVISANKFIGFGRTGTQEETHVGASPECCPAVLVTPPLAEDHVLVVQGAEAMVIIRGYGRDARCVEILKPESDPAIHRRKWARRTMLFMDALELDLESRDAGLPDLQPGNVRRELRKAYLAFQSGAPGEPYTEIYTGYWGCRTFGGNVGVKTLIQWIAASLAGSPLRFICSGSDQRAFGTQLLNLVRNVRGKGCDSTAALLRLLLELTLAEIGDDLSLSLVEERLQMLPRSIDLHLALAPPHGTGSD